MSGADDSAAGPTEWGEGQVGVGPWELQHPGEPRPTGDQWDPELLDAGDRPVDIFEGMMPKR